MSGMDVGALRRKATPIMVIDYSFIGKNFMNNNFLYTAN
jgi:hypothetical protein